MGSCAHVFAILCDSELASECGHIYIPGGEPSAFEFYIPLFACEVTCLAVISILCRMVWEIDCRQWTAGAREHHCICPTDAIDISHHSTQRPLSSSSGSEQLRGLQGEKSVCCLVAPFLSNVEI
jgi:hypothetical protein